MSGKTAKPASRQNLALDGNVNYWRISALGAKVRFRDLSSVAEYLPRSTSATENYIEIKRDRPQSSLATLSASMFFLSHHVFSSPAWWSSRWCPRQSGTVNSSLTLSPIARGCAKRRWCGSEGCRPQTRQGCEATNFRWALSRNRFGSAIASWLLSIWSCFGSSAAVRCERGCCCACLVCHWFVLWKELFARSCGAVGRSSAMDAGSAWCHRDASQSAGLGRMGPAAGRACHVGPADNILAIKLKPERFAKGRQGALGGIGLRRLECGIVNFTR